MIICLAFESVLKKAERYNIISEERSEVFEKKRKIRFAETEKGCPRLADRGWLDIPARACLRQQFAVRRGGRTCRRNSGVHYRLGQPHVEVFAILIYAANTIGVPGAMLSCIIAGMLLLFVATIQFNKSFFKIPPAALGAVTFIVAAVLCIIQVNYYFGIGVPAGSAFETLVAYRSYGFHSNWRGVLYGTITLVIMITYPIKFKKLSRKVPAPAVALVLTTVLNLFLNPVAERTAIDEVGSFASTPSFLLVGDISIFDVTPEKLLPSFIYAWALVVVLVADTLMKENQLSVVRNSLAFKGLRSIICPVCDGMTVGDESSEGETRMTGIFAAVIMIVLDYCPSRDNACADCDSRRYNHLHCVEESPFQSYQNSVQEQQKGVCHIALRRNGRGGYLLGYGRRYRYSLDRRAHLLLRPPPQGQKESRTPREYARKVGII